ncbi:MAG: efflux RND transporter periplasmic adaptor subunit [Robiginitalea sp.]|jgi:cobalt-zinc-cadmium efflux system membrane fusion protein
MKPSRISLLLMLSLGILISCKQQAEKPAEKPAPYPNDGLIHVSREQFESNAMALGQMEKRQFPEVIRISGTIDVPPENRVVISAVYGGYVKRTTLLEGDIIRKGQVLVTLQNPEFLTLQQQYLELSEQLPYLKAEHKRQETLYKEQISSEKVYLKSQSDYNTALARKSSLEGQLSMLGIRAGEINAGNMRSEISIRSSIDGKVNSINVRTGAYVSPATEIMEIVNTDHIHLEMLVFEKDVSRIEIGQEIHFRIPEISDQVFKGSVYLIGSTIDQNRTVKVHGHLLKEAPDNLMVGMFIQAEILIPNNRTASVEPLEFWALPEAAIVTMAEQDHVLVLEATTKNDYAFRKIPVKKGNSGNGYISLSEFGALEATSQVLVNGAILLIEEGGSGSDQ